MPSKKDIREACLAATPDRPVPFRYELKIRLPKRTGKNRTMGTGPGRSRIEPVWKTAERQRRRRQGGKGKMEVEEG